MPVNPNWARWTFASVATLLRQVAKDAKIPSFVEGLDERTTEFTEAPMRVEIRMTGPFTRELSKDYYELGVDVNALLFDLYETNGNQYDVIGIAGLFHEAMDNPIPLKRYGDKPGDDEGLLGCLLTRAEKNDAVRVFHFGQTDTTDRQKQIMIDARYVVYLDS
jgi:hypothetical protein